MPWFLEPPVQSLGGQRAAWDGWVGRADGEMGAGGRMSGWREGGGGASLAQQAGCVNVQWWSQERPLLHSELRPRPRVPSPQHVPNASLT